MILIKIVNSYNGEKIDTSVTSKKKKQCMDRNKNVKKIVAKYKEHMIWNAKMMK